MDSKQIEKKVLVALEEIRPFLASDGGDISLVSIENDKKVFEAAFISTMNKLKGPEAPSS